jgi:hypothetical protein
MEFVSWGYGSQCDGKKTFMFQTTNQNSIKIKNTYQVVTPSDVNVGL